MVASVLGSVSISDKTSYRKISWSFEATRFVFRIVQSLRNLTGTSAALRLNAKNRLERESSASRQSVGFQVSDAYSGWLRTTHACMIKAGGVPCRQRAETYFIVLGYRSSLNREPESETLVLYFYDYFRPITPRVVFRFLYRRSYTLKHALTTNDGRLLRAGTIT